MTRLWDRWHISKMLGRLNFYCPDTGSSHNRLRIANLNSNTWLVPLDRSRKRHNQEGNSNKTYWVHCRWVGETHWGNSCTWHQVHRQTCPFGSRNKKYCPKDLFYQPGNVDTKTQKFQLYRVDKAKCLGKPLPSCTHSRTNPFRWERNTRHPRQCYPLVARCIPLILPLFAPIHL